MIDELDDLRQNKELLALLTHYVQISTADGTVWHDRLMELPGVSATELAHLHGRLIAYSWVEQNTGNTPVHKAGVVAACYRATSLGCRAVKLALRAVVEDDDWSADAA